MFFLNREENPALPPADISNLLTSRRIKTQQQVEVSSLCPNVLLLLHSLFNEYSDRQINTDRTADKRGERGERGRGGGGEEMVER